MLMSLHWILIALYVAAPIVALVRSSLARARGKSPDRGYVFTWCAGIAMAVGLNVVYAATEGGKILPTEVLLASYFGAATLFLLKGFDILLGRGLMWIFQLGPYGVAPPRPWRRTRLASAALTRTGMLIFLVLPFVMASVLVYRPHVRILGNPTTLGGLRFDTVEFPAIDGLRISAWWVPARAREGHPDPVKGRDTVIICPGIAESKGTQIQLLTTIVGGGYNALVIDCRGHGESEGHLCSFGDFERRDVLGAVRWLSQNHSIQCRRILGIGSNTGAAAMLGAAADDSAEGQAISGIVVINGFDDLPKLTHDISRHYFLPPFNWLLPYVSLPMASIQSGAGLTQFKPAQLAQFVWPRPVMVMQQLHNETIPFERGRKLFDALSPPRDHIWYDKKTPTSDYDATTSLQILNFLDRATPRPII